MKTPRFFIAFAIFAFVFTTALISLDSAVRPARAETLPVLRVNPWAGDPQEPGFSRQLPFEESYGEMRAGIGYEVTSSGPITGTTPLRVGPRPWWSTLRHAQVLEVILSCRRGLLW